MINYTGMLIGFFALKSLIQMAIPILFGKFLNRCIPRKNASLAPVENPLFLANKFNEFYADAGKVTALKAANLAEEHNLNIQDTVGIHPCEADRTTGENL